MARLQNLKIEGFRAFGSATQTIEFGADITVIWAPNSQGKTSVAEALEFLLCGRISRKALLGSAAREFAGSLKNVHSEENDTVKVSALISTSTQGTVEVVRELVRDYGQSGDCESRLTVDGVETANLQEFGISLSQPPLETPIMLQHNLRFVLAARPQDRLNYFKAILEITDLERFRDAVKRAKDSLPDADTAYIPRLLRTLEVTGLQEAGKELGRGSAHAATERCLAEALATYLDVEAGTDLQDLVEVAQARRDQVRETLFPFAALRQNGAVPPAPEVQPAIEALDRYSQLVGATRQATEALHGLYQAYLELPDQPEIGEDRAAIDCPLCLTQGAIGTERIAEMRRELEESATFRAAKSDAARECADLRRGTAALRAALEQAVPEVVRWTAEERVERGVERGALGLLFSNDPTALEGWLEAISAAHEALAEARVALDSLLTAVPSELETGASSAHLQKCHREGNSALESLGSALNRLQPQSDRVARTLQPVVDAQAQLEPLGDLVELAQAKAAVGEEWEQRRRIEAVETEIQGAVTEIDEATASVLDEKFLALAAEINRWWLLMRPEEPSFFSGVQRVGSGRRFMDLKMGLARDATDREGAHERDAVAVASDSQMNCLGLAAFLARVVRAPVGFVVLDDPIQGSDTEHKATFVDQVPENVLQESQQVVILTHDERLSRDIQNRYAHRDLRAYSVLVEDPAAGAKAVATRDTIDEMLARAVPLRHKEDLASRKQASSTLRDAAERFCKLILVKEARAAGQPASLSDYDGANLGALVTQTEPYLVQDPSHPGKLRVIRDKLNPGNHDDGAASAGDHRVVFGDLKKLREDYL